MTLSKFDWTDKNSVKWFILLPTGHEGPYSLHHLLKLQEQKKIAGHVNIWAEGLPSAVTLKEVLKPRESKDVFPPKSEVPDLPPLPEVELPPLPVEAVVEEKEPVFAEGPLENEAKEAAVKKVSPVSMVLMSLLAVLFIGFLAFMNFRNSGKIDIRRLSKMPVDLHQKILQENPFSSWNKKIFFKEYLPQDHSHIWLVTSSFQNCRVEAVFNSLKDKILSMKDEKISFKSEGHLSGHIAEFSSFEFTSGNRIIPGMYEMDVKAYDCRWDGLLSKAMNKFSPPDKEYMARTKVVLFSKGASEFTKNLDSILLKKMEIELKTQNQNELFWQDLQQKLETLQAVTLQIEQHLLDHIDSEPAAFMNNLKGMIDDYTRKYGSFLTSFVIENENSFRSVHPDAKGSAQKRNYELMVNTASKKIGFETMKFIEEFQGLKKKPSSKKLQEYSARVRKAFAGLKQELGQKIFLVSEDRSK